MDEKNPSSAPQEDKTVEVNLDAISNEAFFALFYARAVIMGGKDELFFKNCCDKSGVPSNVRRRAIQKGLNELAEMGAIDVAKDGEGDYIPVQIHAVLSHGSGLILREGV